MRNPPNRSESIDATAIPDTLHVETVAANDGRWVYRVEYLELSGCIVEERDILRALAQLDSMRDSAMRIGR